MSGDATTVRSRAWMKNRLRELDRQHCTTVAQLQAVLNEQVQLGRKMSMDAVKTELFDCFDRLVQGTPIATGRASAAWQITLELTEACPGPDPASIAQYAAKQAAASLELDDAETIYVLNNVEYILALDAGWSKTWEGGFIGLFLQELKTQLEGVARRL